jgi:hypothetical protein
LKLQLVDASAQDPIPAANSDQESDRSDDIVDELTAREWRSVL